jgi:hypothetical protein
MSLIEACRVTPYLPIGSRGRAAISRFTVTPTDSDFTRLRAAMKGRGYVPAGEYTQLRVNGSQWMSDTPDELRDCHSILCRARGRVLVNGLGLGCVVRGLLAKPIVEHVDVVEIDPDVIALVGPHYAGPRCTIHHADAFAIEWPNGTRWDCAWHDIWQSICGDNVDEMKRLRRKYARRVDWQAFWCESEMR